MTIFSEIVKNNFDFCENKDKKFNFKKEIKNYPLVNSVNQALLK